MKTPAGVRRDTALYINMRDGAQTAADVWLPQDYQVGQRLPVLLGTTRYGRVSLGFMEELVYHGAVLQIALATKSVLL